MSQNIPDDQIEIINDFLQESRDMLDLLEPTIIELGQSCQNIDCWSTLGCTQQECRRHGQALESPCWLDQGWVGDGCQSCMFASSETDCRSCQVFELTNGNNDTMNAIFRLFHSMKGSAGFLELDNISHVAHQAENLLDLIRSGKVKLESEHVTLLCQACDYSRSALDHVEKHYQDQGMAAEAEVMAASLEAAISLAQARVAAIHAETGCSGSSPVVEAAPTAARSDVDAFFENLVTPELLGKFVQEGDELLQDIEQGLLAWEKDGLQVETIAELFRSMHSFKGNCGFTGYGDMERLSHHMETILDAVKGGCDPGGNRVQETLLQMIDVLRSALAEAAGGGRAEIDDLDTYLQVLQEVINSIGSTPAPDPEELRLADLLVRQGLVEAGCIATLLRVKRQPLVEALVQEQLLTRQQIDDALKPAGPTVEPQTPVAAKSTSPPSPIKPAAAKPVSANEPSLGNKPTKAASVNRQDIRVDLDKLDKLINLIGEMVIAENMLVNNPDLTGLELENFGKASQQMSKIVRELQEMAMVIRMIPVSGLFRRMIRLVHDISFKSGKKVELELSGEETEIDKTVIEQISDPLVHLLRNSLDHGLEPPDERRAAGKPEKGTVRLSAKHEEGEVWITVEDDGRGLDRDKLLAKAISKGLIQGDGSEMSEKAVFNLIFHPGFSTAEKITDISGRGVGMDVVRQNLEKIKGKIDVGSKLGQGTQIRLRIPLTLAIIDGLMIRVGHTRCILPLLAVREIFRPVTGAITHTPDGQELVRVREAFIPVLRLHSLLQQEPDSRRLSEGTLVVLENQDARIALFVDEILGQQQTVIKGLSSYLGNVNFASGCTILGNGDVCLILDVGSLIDVSEEGRFAACYSQEIDPSLAETA